MNRKLGAACHFALWAYMFLSPLTFWRGTGVTLPHYLMFCMQPLMLMIVFYLNYLYLGPRLFVAGKHRYDVIINVVLVLSLAIALHYWIEYTNEIYQPQHVRNRVPDNLDIVLHILRNSINFAIFAGGATALALARKFFTADQKLKESEAARVKAELVNLRSQVNPHFLLNTLNNIYALTAFDTEKAQSAIQELSRMLRHILYDYQQPTVPLKDEVEFIENYVKLMQIRLPQSVDVQFQASVSNPQQEVTPMLFISLVENAFKHGVSPTEPSFVHINFKADEQQIVCDISNSNNPKTANDHSGHGIGLSQVQRRLDLAYPNRYEWQRGVSEDHRIYSSKITINI